MKAKMTEPELLANCACGIYNWQIAIKSLKVEIKAQISNEEVEIVEFGPDHEDYIEVVANWAPVMVKVGRQKVEIIENEGDIWAVPACYKRTKEYREWIGI
jgi:hypothetical protein